MAPGVSTCQYQESPPSISFSGSGFMAVYQLGVAQCFQNHVPWILHTAPFVLGASAGSLVAAAVVCEISLISLRDEMLNFAKHMKAFTLGPLNPSINVFHWLKIILDKYLPSNAHQMANGRLAVAMSRMSDRKLFIMSDFHSREDVLQALLCSCFVPVYCGLVPPSFKGEHYVDGGFTSMQPVLPLPFSHILTVSPFSGEIDICPTDKPCMLDMVVNGTTLKGNIANSLRILNALYPMALKSMEEAYDNGYKDGLRYLQSKDVCPYLTLNVHQEPLVYNQTKTLGQLEVDMKQEEVVKVEKVLTTLTDYLSGSAENESSEDQQTEEPPLHFDLVKNVLLYNVMTYVSMFGIPATIVSRLLLPFTMFLYALHQSRHRMESLFRPKPELVVWCWHYLRHFGFFFFNIMVSSIKKNLENRIIDIILLLEVAKMNAPREAQRNTESHQTLTFPSSVHS